MNSVKRDLIQIQLLHVPYILLYAVCSYLWGKDLYGYIVYNTQPTRFTVMLSIVMSLGLMITMFLKNMKSLIEWYKIYK